MQAIIYHRETHEIMGVVHEVQSIDNNSVIGPHESYRGLDFSILGVLTVPDGTIETLPETGYSRSTIDPDWINASTPTLTTPQNNEVLQEALRLLGQQIVALKLQGGQS